MKKTIPANRDDAIAFHRAELERLTGMAVHLRNREKFNEAQRTGYRARKERIKALEAEAAARAAEDAARHDPFCTCDECYARAQAVQQARTNQQGAN